MRNSTFVNWLAQMLLGFGLVVASLQLGVIFWASASMVFGVTCAVIGLAGLAILIRAEKREQPLRVLRKARRKLQLPTQWQVRFDKAPKKGSRAIPIAVIRGDGVRFVIDVQTHKEATWTADTRRIQPWPVFGKKMPKKASKRNPLAPLLQAAETWGATAVVWLPDATEAETLSHEESHLMVVLGNGGDLKKALQSPEIRYRPMPVSAKKGESSAPAELEEVRQAA